MRDHFSLYPTLTINLIHVLLVKDDDVISNIFCNVMVNRKESDIPRDVVNIKSIDRNEICSLPPVKNDE